MTRPKLLVIGVDIQPQPRYPFPFFCGDAMQVLSLMSHGMAVRFKQAESVQRIRIDDIAVIHASPPCQAFSIMRHLSKQKHPELVGPVRDMLMNLQRKWARPAIVHGQS